MDRAGENIPRLKRGRKRRTAVAAGELIGRKYLATFQKYAARLRELYPHPNRVLHYDDVVTTLLLGFYNPTMRSLRCIEDASELPCVNRYLSVQSVCKSTLSDANALFDPKHLEGLINALREDLPRLDRQDAQLDRLLSRAKAVDGSYFRVASEVQWAFRQRKPDKKPMGQVRLDCQFCLKTGCPDGIDVHGDDGVSEGSAATAFTGGSFGGQPPEPDSVFLFDSGVVKFSYLRRIVDQRCHFLCNLRKHVLLQDASDHPLDAAARAAGVISDRTCRFASTHAPRGRDAAPDVLVREVCVAYVDRKGKSQTLRLVTSLVDLPASLIAELYRHRWEVELFFRWLKVQAHFRHLISHGKNGVLLGFHVAIIAMLLTCLHTQAALSKYAYGMFCFVAAGQATLEDVTPILLKRTRERALERKRLAEKKAQKSQA